MGLFSSSTTFDSMETLFLDQLHDIYDAEQRLTKALPKMAECASDSSLKSAFTQHLAETEGHVKRLEQVFESINQPVKGKTCAAMEGLLKEGSEVLSAKGDPSVIDAALIASAQRVEHYEMAAYGSIRTFAKRLGYTDAVKLLQQNLDEEGAADKKLTQIAESVVNPAATSA